MLRRRRRRIAIRQLTALDDLLLADIGLNRNQIALADDGNLTRHGDGLWRHAKRPAEEQQHELPQAA